MKFKYLLIFALISLISCTTNNNDESFIIEDDMMDIMDDDMDIMDDDMSGEEDDMSSFLQGDFISGAHPTTGKVTVNQEKTILSFKDLMSDDGPLLEVYLSTDLSSTAFITLGELQGLTGDFDYSLPENIDFSTYKYVHIWCVDFSVSFGHAILE